MKNNYMEALLVGAVALLMLTGSSLASEMDKRIESSAQGSYVFRTYLKDDTIRIQSQDGVVTLIGTVEDESHSMLAADTVADLPGVKSVDNQLVVKSDYRGTNAFTTYITVGKGVVTVTGTAGTPAEKEFVSRRIENIHGVVKIDNQMIVR